MVVALDAVLCQNRHLAVIHVAHPAGVADEGGDVAGQEAAPVAVAQDQGAVLADGDDLVRGVGAEDAQGVGPLDAAQAPAHRLQNAHPVVLAEVLYQLGHHLGVRLRGEGHPLALEKVLQLGVVLNDAVVDHGDPAAAADLGVGVDVRRGPVGGPAGVAHSHLAGHRPPAVQHFVQDGQPPLCLVDGESGGGIIHRHAGGVVAPVLQLAQALQQKGGRLLVSNVSNDTAHIKISSDKIQLRGVQNTIPCRKGRHGPCAPTV